MKTTTYSISPEEKQALNKSVKQYLSSLARKFADNPSGFSQSSDALIPVWVDLAHNKAIFEQVTRDGLATISKSLDPYYTFADHAGDTFCPMTNHDICPKELKRQERKARARLSKQGAFYMELTVLGEVEDASGGFVGNDFYGSGYDNDFYRCAIEILSEAMPDYIHLATQILSESTPRYIEAIKGILPTDLTRTT